jgi:hypothetical protein
MICNFNGLYVVGILFMYNIWMVNYEHITWIIDKIIMFDYISVMICINIIGIYLFLKNVTFECKISYK